MWTRCHSLMYIDLLPELRDTIRVKLDLKTRAALMRVCTVTKDDEEGAFPPLMPEYWQWAHDFSLPYARYLPQKDPLYRYAIPHALAFGLQRWPRASMSISPGMVTWLWSSAMTSGVTLQCRRGIREDSFMWSLSSGQLSTTTYTRTIKDLPLDQWRAAVEATRR